MSRSEPSLVSRILSGGSREQRLLAARGLLPVSPEELIPVQVALARGDDPEVAEAAAASLRELSPRLASAHLASAAGADELAYFAIEIGHPRLIETVLRRRDVARPLLVELAPRLGEELQELLLLRQDAVVDEPAILDALEKNPRLSSYARRRIGEYREHLLPRKQRAPSEEKKGEVEEATDEELAEAIEEAKARRPEGFEIDQEAAKGLSEAELRALNVSVRLRLARGAPRALRAVLLRDPNPQVAVQVLRTNALSDSEVEQIAHNRSLDEEVLEFILANRGWIRKYPILRAVLSNPRTPVGPAVRLVPRLSVRDLKQLSRDRNASRPVRDTALRLYRIKRL